MPFLNRKQVIALKVENTEGTSSNPGVADAGFNTFSTTWSPEVESYERNPFRSSLGRLATINGVKTGTIGFETELVGSGNHADATPTNPAWHTLMLACGFEQKAVTAVTIPASSGVQFTAGEVLKQSGVAKGTAALSTKVGDTVLYVVDSTGTGTTAIVGETSGADSGTLAGSPFGDTDEGGLVYKPLSGGPAKSYTVALYNAGTGTGTNSGVKHILEGCRGNISFAGSTGQPVRMTCEFTGPFASTSNSEIIEPTYPTLVPPSLLSAGLSFDGDELVVDSFEINSGNELAVRRSANAATGAVSTNIVTRSMSGSIDPEVELASVHNFIDKMTTNTVGLLDFVVEAGAGALGNKFRIQGPNCSYSGASGGERNGVSTYAMDLSLNETAIGDSDFRLLCL